MTRLLIFYAFFVPWISLLWANSLYVSIPLLGLIVKAFNVLFFFFSIISIIFSSKLTKLKGRLFTGIIGILVALGLFYSILGYFNGFYDKNIADFYTFINGPLLAYAFYQSDKAYEIHKETVNKVSKWILFSLSGAAVVLWVEGMLGIPHYPALASGWAVLPFFLFFLEGKTFKTTFVFLLLVVSGKRSILGLGMIVCSIIALWKRNFSLFTSAIAGMVVLIPLVFAGFIFLEQLPEHNISTLNKLSFINPFSEKFAPIAAAGDRVQEVDAALDAHGGGVVNALFGLGNGFTYELEISRLEVTEEDRHNVHFSPVNYYTRYGIIYAIVFYVTLVACIYRAFSGIRRKEKYEQAMAFYLIFGVISSLNSFSLPLDFLFWFCLGILLRKDKRTNILVENLQGVLASDK